MQSMIYRWGIKHLIYKNKATRNATSTILTIYPSTLHQEHHLHLNALTLLRTSTLLHLDRICAALLGLLARSGQAGRDKDDRSAVLHQVDHEREDKHILAQGVEQMGGREGREQEVDDADEQERDGGGAGEQQAVRVVCAGNRGVQGVAVGGPRQRGGRGQPEHQHQQKDAVGLAQAGGRRERRRVVAVGRVGAGDDGENQARQREQVREPEDACCEWVRVV